MNGRRTILSLCWTFLLAGLVLARDKPNGYPLWDGKESQADYAKRTGMKDVEITLDLGDGVKMKLILIPAGKFLMGDPDSTKKPMTIRETPQHEVTITRPFYMAATELTQAQYEQVMGKSGNLKKSEAMDKSTALAVQAGERKDYEKTPDLPADHVNWVEAVEFCKTLSSKLSTEITLPTEAQWEHAYCAGTTTDFFWGNTRDADNTARAKEYAWFSGNCGGDAKGVLRVAQKKPNPWGLYDMAGNALEFTLDYGRSYTEDAQIDPVGHATAGMKGGYCGNQLEWLTHYHRKGGDPNYKMEVVNKWKERFTCQGFRVIVLVDDEGRPASVK